MRVTVWVVALSLATCAAPVDGRQAPRSVSQAAAPIFVFDHPFWLNLHRFLDVLGRAEAKTIDSQRRAVSGAPAEQASGLAGLSEDERRVWTEAVTFYARGPSRKDTVFDEDMVRTGRVLVDAGDRPSMDGLPLDHADEGTGLAWQP